MSYRSSPPWYLLPIAEECMALRSFRPFLYCPPDDLDLSRQYVPTAIPQAATPMRPQKRVVDMPRGAAVACSAGAGLAGAGAAGAGVRADHSAAAGLGAAE